MSPLEAQAEFHLRGWRFSEYRHLTITRNPFARLVSLFEMIWSVDRLTRFRRTVGLFDQTFAAWLATVRPEGRGGGGWHHQRWRRYGGWSARTWVHDETGEQLVGTILRLEDLNTELPATISKLELPVKADLLHLNGRVSRDYRRYYTDASKALVQNRYAWDLKTFNYSFEK